VKNNYETDLIFPIVEAAAKKAGIEYASADEATKTSLKVRKLFYILPHFRLS
jgi:alanyl-tRNA synthetase